MNNVNQEYLDRGEGIYIAKVDSIAFVAGLNKIWFKWWLPGDPRITKTEIRWIEGIETKTKEYVINHTQTDTLAMEIVMDNFPEGNFTFEFINWDSEGNRSISVGAMVEVPGNGYIESLRTRVITIVTKFGNGYAVVWGASNCLYSDLSYRTLNGETVSMRLPADNNDETPRLLLYDYDGSGLTQTTSYLYETPIFTDTITVPASTYTFYNDVSATVIASTATIIGAGNFDLGGEGVGFHDSNTGHDPGSNGANYRPNLGDYGSAAMDIEGDGGNIGYSNPGEWLNYTVDVQEDGYYEIDWYISVNTSSGSACHIEVDDHVFKSYPLEDNANWSDWRYYCERNGVIPPYLFLTKGKHVVKFVWEAGGFNINGLRIRTIDPDDLPVPLIETALGHWEFDDSGNPGKATVGQDLGLFGNITQVDGPKAANKAVRIDAGGSNYLKVTHGLTPDADDHVSNWTIMIVFKMIEKNGSNWHTIMQTDITPSGDADFFIRENGNVGVGALGYKGPALEVNKWYCLVMLRHNNVFNSYVNGVLYHDNVDGSNERFNLSEAFLISQDDDGEDNIIDIAEVAVWKTSLSPDEILLLNNY
jgi:hypothetical protein